MGTSLLQVQRDWQRIECVMLCRAVSLLLIGYWLILTNGTHWNKQETEEFYICNVIPEIRTLPFQSIS